MDAATTFFVSLALLIAFVAFRFSEERRGVKVWADTRAKADAVVSEMYRAAVVGNIPAEYREAFVRFLRTLAHDALVFLIEGLRAVERPLTRLSYRMRRVSPPTSAAEPSAFLKTIIQGKKNGADVGTTPPDAV